MKDWKYKNTTFLIISLIVFVYILNKDFAQIFIKNISALGYAGSFLAGIFFVSVFTIAPASVILLDISKTLSPYLVALFAGVGAMLGDYMILRVLKDRVFEELLPLLKKTENSFFSVVFSSPFFSWMIPLFGAIIIASPLPDEIGIGLMGLSRIKKWQFLLITFALNAVGIFAVIVFGNSI